MAKSGSVAHSHWVKGVRGLRPVLHRPRPRHCLVPALAIVIVLLSVLQVESLSEPIRELNTRSILKF